MTAPAAKIHGLGIGPGDPELLTLKALRLLQAADLIAYPAPETGESFARRIALPHFPPGVTEFPIRMNIGDGSYPKDEVYAAAARHLAAAAKAGQRVVVLCEGDPFFYGSFIYLYERLAPEIAIEIVPGVSSIMACADLSLRPLAEREQVFSVIPASLPEDEIATRLRFCDSAALIKLGRHAGKCRRLLAALGWLDCAQLVIRASLPDQAHMPLRDWAEEAAPYFSMILLHKSRPAS